MDFQKQLGRNVSKLRNGVGLTQEQLSEAASIDRSYLQRIEAGTTNPTFDVLIRLGKALGASWRDMTAQIELGAGATATSKPPKKTR